MEFRAHWRWVFLQSMMGCICGLLLITADPELSVAGEPVPTEISVGMAIRAPWTYQADNGRLVGIDVDIMRAMEKRLGVRFVFRIYPWRRCIEQLEQGRIDVIARFSRTPEREVFAHFITPPYSKERIVLYVRKTSGSVIRRYADLYGKRVGVIRGNSYIPRFDSDTRIQKTILHQKEQIFNMLVAGRIDVAVLYEWVARHQLDLQGLVEEVRVCPFKFERGDADHFAISRKSAYIGLAPQFKNAVGDMLARGEIADIMNRFVSGNRQKD